MRNIKLLDRKTTVVGMVTRMDLLLSVNGEYQHHYISLPLEYSGIEVRQAIADYIKINVRFRNYSDEQQAIKKRAFKGFSKEVR